MTKPHQLTFSVSKPVRLSFALRLIFCSASLFTCSFEECQRRLKREFDLRFQAAIVGRLVKALAILRARDLVCQAEIRRSDVPDDRSGICVVDQIPNRETDAQVEAVRGGRAADQSAQSAPACRRQRGALAGGGGGVRTAGSAAFLTQAEQS